MHFFRFDFLALEERHVDAVVAFHQPELAAEGAGLVDLDLFAVDGGQVAGICDADQIVTAVGDSVAIVIRRPFEGDFGRQAACCQEQECSCGKNSV